ncbi:hypothetical protein GQ44DRAFT_719480 [Phaeosphaeriaceae sp. PMI808]|nr:hypothetical protein GQ44DRAFT_719480 [Phaeosphaeriaceae sp. PMI808]
MKCTYGLSSECLTFIRQTADDDTAKVTSWGCGERPTSWIIVAESSSLSTTSSSFRSQTAAQYTSRLPSQSFSSMPSSSGLSMGGKVGLGVGVAVGGLIILGAVASIFYRAGKRSRGNQANNRNNSAGIVPKPELEGTQRLEDGGKQVPNGERVLSVPTERAELGISGSAVELEGSSRLDSPAARC